MKSSEDLLRRARRIEGQARGIQRMLEEGRDCEQIVQQIGAIRAAVDRLGYQLIVSHLRGCLAGVDLPEGSERQLESSLAALTGMRT